MGAMDTCRYCFVGCAVGYLKLWVQKIPVGIVECGAKLDTSRYGLPQRPEQINFGQARYIQILSQIVTDTSRNMDLENGRYIQIQICICIWKICGNLWKMEGIWGV